MDAQEMVNNCYSEKHCCPNGHVWWFNTIHQDQVGLERGCPEPGCGGKSRAVNVQIGMQSMFGGR